MGAGGTGMSGFFTITIADIQRCPGKVLSAKHYRPDGSCRHTPMEWSGNDFGRSCATCGQPYLDHVTPEDDMALVLCPQP